MARSIANAETNPWFILYGGTSTDGRGTPLYEGRTTDIDKAIRHLKTISKSPYSVGKVMVFTQTNEFQASIEGLERMKAALSGTPINTTSQQAPKDSKPDVTPAVTTSPKKQPNKQPLKTSPGRMD